MQVEFEEEHAYWRSLGLWEPIVTVQLLPPRDQTGGISIPLTLDTGADMILVDAAVAPFLGIRDLEDCGVEEEIDVVGGQRATYRIDGFTVSVFGGSVQCPVYFLEGVASNASQGLLGRAGMVPFGIGVWESVHRIYATQL